MCAQQFKFKNQVKAKPVVKQGRKTTVLFYKYPGCLFKGCSVFNNAKLTEIRLKKGGRMKNNLLLCLVTGLLVLIISSIAWADNPTKDELKALIETNSAAISSNTGETADNTAAINDNAGDIADNTADINDNAGDIADNTADISTNANNIADNTADISTNANNIADILDRLEILESFHPCMKGRFCDMQNGTVRDNKTGLIWLKDASCMGEMTWWDARADVSMVYHSRCGLTDFSEMGDWRLPTIDEWEAFIEDSIEDGYRTPVLCDATGLYPTSEGDPFLGVISDEYWSDTPDDSLGEGYAWICDMGSEGDLYPEFFQPVSTSSINYVWPVRSAD
jgi:hypothetical protein